MSKKFSVFVVGGLVGAAIALLYAPRSGKETRVLVSEKINDTWGEAQAAGFQVRDNVQQFYRDAAGRGQSVYEGAAVRIQEAGERATARVQEAGERIKPVFAERSDELREKIEAARQRIASQVARNASEAVGVAEDTVNMTVGEEKSAVGGYTSAIDEAVKAASKEEELKKD